ncbi:hypothetical protein JOD25_002986 [Kurthia huakuii]|nr:hypothetical protein [Kurthia huakuii]
MEKYDNGRFYELTMEFKEQQLVTALHELQLKTEHMS